MTNFLKTSIMIICIFFILISCNDNENKEELNNVIRVSEPSLNNVEPFSIKLIFSSNVKGEVVATFGDIDFNNQDVVYKVKEDIVIGKNDFNAKMFGDYIPFLIQIDFGRNQEKELNFISAIIEYDEKKIEITPKELQKYFYINKFIDYDKEKGLIKTKRVNKSLAPIITLKKKQINKIFDLI